MKKNKNLIDKSGTLKYCEGLIGPKGVVGPKGPEYNEDTPKNTAKDTPKNTAKDTPKNDNNIS